MNKKEYESPAIQVISVEPDESIMIPTTSQGF